MSPQRWSVPKLLPLTPFALLAPFTLALALLALLLASWALLLALLLSASLSLGESAASGTGLPVRRRFAGALGATLAERHAGHTQAAASLRHGHTPRPPLQAGTVAAGTQAATPLAVRSGHGKEDARRHGSRLGHAG